MNPGDLYVHISLVGKKIILCKTLVRTLSGRPAGLSLRRMQGSFQGEAAGMTVDGYIAMARGMR